jgi:hypothetical protein
LQGLPGVRQAAVIDNANERRANELVGYVVGHPDLTAADLRQAAAQVLPAYMIPAHFVLLPSLPLTPNGKVDRRALPPHARVVAQQPRTPAAPGSPLEETILKVWKEVFGRVDIGIDDNFFDLGGHSLMATRVVSRLNQALACTVSLGMLFESPTVRGLALRVSVLPPAKTPGIITKRTRSGIRS